MWDRLAAAAATFALVGTYGPADAADFHLYRNEPAPAGPTVIDFDAISNPSPGLRTVTFYAAPETPFLSQTYSKDGRVLSKQRPAAVAAITYTYDCPSQRVRAENLVYFDAQLRVIAEQSGPSVWRPLKADYHVAEDFRRFCSTNPRAGDIGPTIRASSWQQAVEQAKTMIHQ